MCNHQQNKTKQIPNFQARLITLKGIRIWVQAPAENVLHRDVVRIKPVGFRIRIYNSGCLRKLHV